MKGMARKTINIEAERCLPASRAAEILGVHRSMIYRLLVERRLEFVQVGRRRVVPERALLAFIEQNRRIAVADLARKLYELEKKYDSQFQVVFNAIRKLMAPPETEKEQRRIGFRQEVKN